MPPKTYTAPSVPFALALRVQLLSDPTVKAEGVTIQNVVMRQGSTSVEVIADVDPSAADAEIQAVIDAHDPAADLTASPDFLAQQARIHGAVSPYFIGSFASSGDLPSPTMDAAIASVDGEGLYVRSGGAWGFSGSTSPNTLLAQNETASTGGDPRDCVPSYTQLTGCVWDLDYIRSSTDQPRWQARAFAGTLASTGDRIDFPAWAANPEGGSLGLVFLPAGTEPAPMLALSLEGTWGSLWTGGVSVVFQSNRWRVRANGSNGDGFPAAGPWLVSGDQLLVAVLADGSIEIRNNGSSSSSSFGLPVGGLDVWVVFERAHQRWPAAFATLAAAPVPGVPDGPDTTAYVPTRAVAFDGVDDRVVVPNSAIGNVLLWDQDWTLAVRLPSNDAIDTDSFQNMAGRGSLNAVGLNRVSGSSLRLHAWRQSMSLDSATLSIPGSTDLTGAVVFFEYDATGQELRLHVDEDLVAKISAQNFAATAAYTSADMLIGNMAMGSSSVYGGWAGMMHEMFWLDRLMTEGERADARDPNLANHAWFGDVVGWLPLGTGDTFPTMTNRVAGSSDGTLTNAPSSAIVEI